MDGMEMVRTKAKKMSPADMASVAGRVKALRMRGIGITEACEAVALEDGREPATVYGLMRRLEPTTDIAKAYIESQALRLAMRVVRNSNPQEAIDILGRKNMGVLSPKQDEHAGGGGFFLSVQAESCGAVKIGVMSGAQRQEGGAKHTLTGAPLGEEEFYAAAGSPLSLQEGDEDTSRVPRQSGGRGHQHEDRGHAHPRGVRSRQDAPVETLQTIDVHPQEQEVTNGQTKRNGIGQQGHIRQLGEITDRQAKAIQSARERLKIAQRKRGRELRRQRITHEASAQSE